MAIQGCDICSVMKTVYKILVYLVSDLFHSRFIPQKNTLHKLHLFPT